MFKKKKKTWTLLKTLVRYWQAGGSSVPSFLHFIKEVAGLLKGLDWFSALVHFFILTFSLTFLSHH